MARYFFQCTKKGFENQNLHDQKKVNKKFIKNNVGVVVERAFGSVGDRTLDFNANERVESPLGDDSVTLASRFCFCAESESKTVDPPSRSQPFP